MILKPKDKKENNNSDYKKDVDKAVMKKLNQMFKGNQQLNQHLNNRIDSSCLFDENGLYIGTTPIGIAKAQGESGRKK